MRRYRKSLLHASPVCIAAILTCTGLIAGCGSSGGSDNGGKNESPLTTNYAGQRFAYVGIVSQPDRRVPLVPKGEVKSLGDISVVDPQHETRFNAMYVNTPPLPAPVSVRMFVCELDNAVVAGPFTLQPDTTVTAPSARWTYQGAVMSGTAANAPAGIKIVKLELKDQNGNTFLQPLGTFYFSPDPSPFDINPG